MTRSPAVATIALQSARPNETVALQAVALAGDDVPDWIHLIPAGKVLTADNRGPYDASDLAAIVANSNALATRLPIDENHAIDVAAKNGGASPARGWIVELQARDDGIWGRVEWTRPGRVLVAGKAYRHISPVIAHDRKKVISHVLRASLVNNPNLIGLTALNASETSSMDLLSQIRQLLGLPDTADDATVLAAVGNQGSLAACSSQVATIAGLAGKDTTVVLNAVQERFDPAKFVPASALVELQARFSALSSDTARGKAEAFVDAAIKAGKPIVTALRDHYVTRHMADPASVETELNAMGINPLLQASGATGQKPGGDDNKLTADETKAIALMGIDEKSYLEHKKSLGQRVEML